jgi:hypothetical protein
MDPSDRSIHDGVLRRLDADGRHGDEEDDQFRLLEHDPEKWVPVFGKDHAQTKLSESDEQVSGKLIRKPQRGG